MVDEVLMAWFYGGESWKSEFFVFFSIEMVMVTMGLTAFFTLCLALRLLGKVQL